MCVGLIQLQVPSGQLKTIKNKQMKWRNIKIRNKLFISFILIIFFAGVIVCNSLYSINSIITNTKTVESSHHVELLFSQQYNNYLKWATKMRSTVLSNSEMTITFETGSKNCLLGKWLYSSERKEAEKLFPEIKIELDGLENVHDRLHNAVKEIYQLLMKDDKASALTVFRTKANTYLFEMSLTFQSIKDIISLKNEKVKNSHLVNVQAKKKNLLILGLTVILVSLLLSLLVTISLTNDMNATVDVSNQIAKGNLGIDFTLANMNRKDEIGDIMRASYETTKNFKSIVTSVVGAADNIVAASQKMSSSAQQISKNTEEQGNSDKRNFFFN